jgi:hypothetical protein
VEQVVTILLLIHLHLQVAVVVAVTPLLGKVMETLAVQVVAVELTVEILEMAVLVILLQQLHHKAIMVEMQS